MMAMGFGDEEPNCTCRISACLYGLTKPNSVPKVHTKLQANVSTQVRSQTIKMSQDAAFDILHLSCEKEKFGVRTLTSTIEASSSGRES